MNDAVASVREFNRFYTVFIGALNEGLLDSPFSLTEMRLLYELDREESISAGELCRRLALDAGYVSRLMKNFEKEGLVTRSPDSKDRRQTRLSLTAEARAAFRELDSRADEQVRRMLEPLPRAELEGVARSMRIIRRAFDKQGVAEPYLLRTHQPGDLGWLVYRHGALYAENNGYNEQFEALVAEIAAGFLRGHDPQRERCWIAERDGEIVGSVMLVKSTETQAKLRLLLVEPSARGMGIGTRLVAELIRFARQARYSEIILWTQDDLHAARRLYAEAGFGKIDEERHSMFGFEQVAEVWRLEL